jgi:hypothetical protein
MLCVAVLSALPLQRIWYSAPSLLARLPCASPYPRLPQSVMLVELDGPRKRTVGVQVVGQAKAGGS